MKAALYDPALGEPRPSEPSAGRKPTRRRAVVALLCALGGAASLQGCTRAPSPFTCSATRQCEGSGGTGTCEPTGYCSFPDPGCPSGRRYGAHGPADLSSACTTPLVVDASFGDGARLDGAVRDGSAGEHAAQDGAPAPWWDKTYRYRKTVYVARGVSKSTLMDFPVLVALPADPDLKAHLATPAGLRFVGPDQRTVYAHEVERWVKEQGTLFAWVKVPRLEAGVMNTFYLYFGYTGSGPPPGPPPPPEVWPDYRAVLHLSDAAASVLTNSAPGGYTALGRGPLTELPGPAASAAGFDAAADTVELTGVQSVLASATSFTLSFWLYADYPSDEAVRTAGEPLVLEQWESLRAGRLIRRTGDSPGLLIFQVDLRTSTRTEFVQLPVERQRWTHLALTFDGTNLYGYANAVAAYSASLPGARLSAGVTGLLTLGMTATGGASFNGRIDELRLGPGAKSAQWIAAERAVVASPQPAVTVSPLEERPPL
ncbi:MAG: hypothetical protein IT371_29230 [Deltaproteobacteria bacterium]|nr:hypothetical protein [Deltaproteobacteria bacterium]